MSSVECLREFVNERLTAAAEEIFGVFKTTIIEYEKEIARQRRLLDIFWKPDVQLHRIEPVPLLSVPPELLQQHVCIQEEVLTDQQPCNREKNSSVDQENPEPPRLKEEQEGLCTGQEGEQLGLNQDTDAFMLTRTHEDRDHRKPGEHQLLSNIPHEAKSQDHGEGEHVDSGSTRDPEPELKKRRLKNKSHSNKTSSSDSSEINCNIHKDKSSFKCDTCGKVFQYKSKLNTHLRSHTGERPCSCDTCGKRFSNSSVLNAHRRIHTGEKPFTCKTCGEDFRFNSGLKRHMRTHTGERPHLCKTCGKRFIEISKLKTHMRNHTREKLFTCKSCGDDFMFNSGLKNHMRAHAGKREFPDLQEKTQ